MERRARARRGFPARAGGGTPRRAQPRRPLPRALDAALKDLSPRTLPHLRLTPQKGGRILSADILPDADGATILWHDWSDQPVADQGLKKSAERLALLR